VPIEVHNVPFPPSELVGLEGLGGEGALVDIYYLLASPTILFELKAQFILLCCNLVSLQHFVVFSCLISFLFIPWRR